ncbi:MAG: Gfo/Idh/MocA family oxidoreductase [Bacillota bacterium]
MRDHLTKELWLIGAGSMAVEYAKVLNDQKIPFIVIGRGENSANTFEESVGQKVYTGGIEKYILEVRQLPEMAIVAVGVDQLANTTLLLLQNGVKTILVEKPAGLNVEEIIKVTEEAKNQKAEIYVAYNRRFYASTLKAYDIIQEDGGVISFIFEFTEWNNVIEKLNKPLKITENWFLANSSHVVDLAFFLGGTVTDVTCYQTGNLPWHSPGSIFVGAGKTKEGSLFSYCANWESPGRWGIEILTRNNRLIFRPMEELSVQKKDTIVIEKIEIDDTLDRCFKPGLYRQVETFINGGKYKNFLLPISDHCLQCKNVYSRMVIIRKQ